VSLLRSPLSGARRILAIMPTWVGDVCMATPALATLSVHARATGARLEALVRPGLDALLAGHPAIDALHVSRMRLDPASVGRDLRRLRTPLIDAAVLFPNSWRSAIVARLCGARRTIGYSRDGRGILLTHPLEAPGRRTAVSATTYYARLAAYATDLPAPLSVPLSLAVSDAELAAADAMIPPGPPLLLVNPGANRADKRWPADRFAGAARAIAGSHGLRTAVTGSPAESELVSDVAQRCGGIDLVSRGVTLGALKGVLRRTALMLCNDTGPRHIAAALGTPCVAIFGPTDHRWTSPLPGAHERLMLAEPFLDDAHLADSHAAACAVDRISVGDVVSAANALIAQRGAH
jgi:heptosyltransferase-2